MATIRVVPLPDGVDQRSSWAVEKNGQRISTHVKKSAAKRRARQEASASERIEVRRTDGTVAGSMPGDRQRSRESKAGGMLGGGLLDVGTPSAGGGLDGLVLDEAQEQDSLDDLDPTEDDLSFTG